MTHTAHTSSFGSLAPAGRFVSVDGYIPTSRDCGPFELTYDHGSEETHDDAGKLTEYGEWWAGDQWPTLVSEALEALAAAEAKTAEWRAEQA